MLIIDRNTPIKQLLDVNQEGVINALIRLNKNFSKLRNPFLRKLFASRVSVADACKIANCNISDFLRTMNSIGFDLATDSEEKKDSGKATPFTLPQSEHLVELDVRPILDAGKDPLKLILTKVRELGQGEMLKLINSFEPLPLIHLLSTKGFASHTEKMSPKLVHTYFFRDQDSAHPEPASMQVPADNAVSSLPAFEDLLAKYRQNLKIIDVTMFEMPQPMMKILESLEELKDEEALFVHHKKVPVYLLPHLHDKGFNYLIRQEEENKVSLLIYKR